VLTRVLSQIEVQPNPNVLVGFDKADDAGVYLLNDQQALVQTIDFFTPVVDDAATYGRIAAANSLSDIYAMGAKPLVALSVLAFPIGIVEESSLVEVIQGGASKMNEAGVPVIGGHSVQDPEMKFGYAVTGIVHPEKLITNASARPGDSLVLTKPLGTGIITTGIKFGKTPGRVEDEAIGWMLRLNDLGDCLHRHSIHAATDITGYGLLGHAWEMANASKVSLSIDADRVPIIEGTKSLVAEKMLPGGIEANRRFLGAQVVWNQTSDLLQQILLDPQTSGGLLISASQSDAEEICRISDNQGFSAWRIGEVTHRQEAGIFVH